MNLEQLASEWLEAKTAEGEAVEKRRYIEDKITALLAINETQEGIHTEKLPGYTLKITNRLTRKVDSDLVQEVAAEHGLSNYLRTLFRWKADIDTRAWKTTSPEVTNLLGRAITTTAGRPSYSIAINKD